MTKKNKSRKNIRDSIRKNYLRTSHDHSQLIAALPHRLSDH